MMKFELGLPLGISFFVVILAVCYEDAAGSHEVNDDYDDYDDDDDTNYDDETMKNRSPGSLGSSNHQSLGTHTIPCYSCHFIFQYNHQQGPINCKDPFSTFDIPTVDCRGACAKVYRKLEGKDEFDLSRNCMPHCKEFRTEKENIECCTTKLCNGSMAAASLNSRCRTLASAIIALVLLFILLR